MAGLPTYRVENNHRSETPIEKANEPDLNKSEAGNGKSNSSRVKQIPKSTRFDMKLLDNMD